MITALASQPPFSSYIASKARTGREERECVYMCAFERERERELTQLPPSTFLLPSLSSNLLVSRPPGCSSSSSATPFSRFTSNITPCGSRWLGTCRYLGPHFHVHTYIRTPLYSAGKEKRLRVTGGGGEERREYQPSSFRLAPSPPRGNKGVGGGRDTSSSDATPIFDSFVRPMNFPLPSRSLGWSPWVLHPPVIVDVATGYN